MIYQKSTDERRVVCLPGGMAVRILDLTAAGLLIVALVFLTVVSVNVGAVRIGVQDIFVLMTSRSSDASQNYAFFEVRLPRIFLGFLAGWCSALAGALLQPIARNPLAEPGLFGISAGSMTMILIVLAFMPQASRSMLMSSALAGGLLVALILMLLVRGAQTSGFTILLMGIAVGSVLSSFDAFLLLYLPADLSYSLANWMAGSLFQANSEAVLFNLPFFFISIAGIVVVGPALRCYELGTHVAMALGEPVLRSRPMILFLAVLLSAASVTAIGPLSFIGILAPQFVGFMTGASGRARLYLSALMGGILVIAADIVTRYSFGGVVSLPLGLSFTLIGVPLFLAIVRLNQISGTRTK